MNATRPALALVSIVATAAAAAVPGAQAAWLRGDYLAAFAQAMEPAQGGDADAQYLLGEAYRTGKGTSADMLSAQVWYFRAARQGHVGAAAQLGLLYAGEHREADARKWLRLAADAGDTGAQGALAALLYNAPDDGHDVADAFILMRRAADAGSAQAKAQLARMQAASPQEAASAPVPIKQADVAPAPFKETAAPAPVKAVAPPPAVQVAAMVPPLVAKPAAPVQPVRVAAVATAEPAPAWRVQVGAFRSAAAAQRAWARLSLRVAPLAGNDPYFTNAGLMTRVQAGADTRGQALALCRAIRAAHWPCFVRAPRPLRFAQAAPLRAETVSVRREAEKS